MQHREFFYLFPAASWKDNHDFSTAIQPQGFKAQKIPQHIALCEPPLALFPVRHSWCSQPFHTEKGVRTAGVGGSMEKVPLPVGRAAQRGTHK